MKLKYLFCILTFAIFILIVGCTKKDDLTSGDIGTVEKEEHQYTLQSILITAEIENAGEFVCENCGDSVIKSIKYDDINIPIISINGDITEMTKDIKVYVSLLYEAEDKKFETICSLKWQGASSLRYPKKNYSVQFLNEAGEKNEICLNDEWGEQSKYCLKANYIDFSHSRNIVSGRLYSQIIHSRNIDDIANSLKNGAVVDGFPVLLFINGEYQGLNTMNIPKDKWMAGMKNDKEDDNDELRQAILMADVWKGTDLRSTITNDFAAHGFDLEYCSTSKTTGEEWVVDSFNNMINFVNSNDGEDFKKGISKYIDVNRTIDSMLFTLFIDAIDNYGKNILWITYDGVKWYPSMYDMDSTWGLYWNGKSYLDPNVINDDLYFNHTALWEKIYRNYKTELKERYFELRKSVLSIENITKEFTLFADEIPEIIYIAEKNKWKKIPNQETNNISQILDFCKKRSAALDEFMTNLK